MELPWRRAGVCVCGWGGTQGLFAVIGLDHLMVCVDRSVAIDTCYEQVPCIPLQLVRVRFRHIMLSGRVASYYNSQWRGGPSGLPG